MLGGSADEVANAEPVMDDRSEPDGAPSGTGVVPVAPGAAVARVDASEEPGRSQMGDGGVRKLRIVRRPCIMTGGGWVVIPRRGGEKIEFDWFESVRRTPSQPLAPQTPATVLEALLDPEDECPEEDSPRESRARRMTVGICGRSAQRRRTAPTSERGDA